MKNSIILTELSREEITAFFDEVKQQIKDLRENFQPVQPPEYLTRTEVRDMLKINMATLHNWTKSGKLKSFGIGNRVYYLRADVLGALMPIK